MKKKYYFKEKERNKLTSEKSGFCGFSQLWKNEKGPKRPDLAFEPETEQVHFTNNVPNRP